MGESERKRTCLPTFSQALFAEKKNARLYSPKHREKRQSREPQKKEGRARKKEPQEFLIAQLFHALSEPRALFGAANFGIGFRLPRDARD